MTDEPGQRDRTTLTKGFRRALFGRLLPIWQEHGWDAEQGGFFDRIDRNLQPVPLPAKRLLVQCRQLFVFSQASRIAPELDCAELAHRCYTFLTERYWDKENGGWFFSLARDGTPHDARKDLYGHAFLLFALAHYHCVFGEAAALEHAARTLDLLETHCAAGNGGFHDAADADWRIVPGERRQNPHMHLLEAFLALAEASGEARYRTAAEAMIRLLDTVFIDPATGTLGESFDDGWRVRPGTGDAVEPGHHFEWYWLLDRAAALFQTQEHALAEPLFAWADRHGIDPVHGGVFDKLGRDGSVLLDTKRLWPLAEAIRAYAARSRRRQDDAGEARLVQLLGHLLDRYLDSGLDAGRGFQEHLDRTGRPLTDALYGSSPYHLLGAYRELTGA
jgi:mannose/cellobiose epimerase-like protein (N-acyl-D-glucosamine 2-epimerase family)